MDGMDEITLTTETRMAEVTPEEVKTWLFKPEDLGFARCAMDDLRGGDAVANAVTVRGILEGEKGPKRDVVLINAAFGLVAAGRAANPAEGVKLAVEALDSGAALAKLEKLKALTNA